MVSSYVTFLSGFSKLSRSCSIAALVKALVSFGGRVTLALLRKRSEISVMIAWYSSSVIFIVGLDQG